MRYCWGMAQGRIRCFLGGFALGSGAVVVCAVAVIYGCGLTFGPPGYPWFNEPGGRKAVLEWARLQSFPERMKSFTIVTAGNMFTRKFEVAFYGEPAEIERWVRSRPGVKDERSKKEVQEEGTVIYEIVPGGGAGFAELRHHPQRGIIEIYAYWS